jgi:hypothetical protein
MGFRLDSGFRVGRAFLKSRLTAGKIRKVDCAMPKYPTSWVDYTLSTGQEFAVAVCGYAAKVRHMYIGKDPVRRAFTHNVIVEEGFCHTGDHCLALDCPLNRSEQEHLLHMLDMNEDEILDTETAEKWGSQSTLDCFLLFVQKMNELLPEEFRKQQKPLKE